MALASERIYPTRWVGVGLAAALVSWSRFEKLFMTSDATASSLSTPPLQELRSLATALGIAGVLACIAWNLDQSLEPVGLTKPSQPARWWVPAAVALVIVRSLGGLAIALSASSTQVHNSMVWIALAAVFLTGYESFALQGFLQGQLLKLRVPPHLSIIGPAALASFFYSGQGFVAAMLVGVTGVGLGALTYWTKSLYPAAIVHWLTFVFSAWVASR